MVGAESGAWEQAGKSKNKSVTDSRRLKNRQLIIIQCAPVVGLCMKLGRGNIHRSSDLQLK